MSCMKPVNLSRVLITRHDKIGDFVLTLPLCKAIKAVKPEIRLAVLVAPVNLEFAKEIAFIDEVICYRKGEGNATLNAIRRFNPDVSISCFIDTDLGWLLWRAGIKYRFAPETKLAQVFFNQCVKQRRSRVEMAEFEYNLALGQSLIPELPLAIEPPILSFRQPEKGPDGYSDVRKRVVFHPGSGGSTDGNLSLDEYLRLGRKAAQMPGVQVFFTFGPDDRRLLDQVKKSLDFPAQLINGFSSLRAFCEFLQGCSLFVSTSTGPMHLAGAVNTSTLSFFGDSRFASSARWKPVNAPERHHSFMLPTGDGREDYVDVEQRLLKILDDSLRDPA